MYVFKRLDGIAAVQTLSRPNRTYVTPSMVNVDLLRRNWSGGGIRQSARSGVMADVRLGTRVPSGKP